MPDHPARERCSWGHCAVVGGLLALISLIPLAWLGAVADAAPRPPVPFDPSFNAAGNPPGVLTPMFGAESAAAAIGVAIQDDGSIVVLADRSPGMLPFVRRYAGDGTPDVLFGDQGIATMPPSSGFVSVALDSDGRIVLAGPTGLVRLTPTGEIDPSFQPPGLGFTVTDVAVLRSGAVAAVGYRGDLPASSQLVVARLLPTGALDPSFAPGAPTPGLLLLQDPAGTTPSVAARADASVVVATGSLLLGLTPTGAADPAFPDDGRVISTNALTDVAFDHSGRVVVVGYTAEDSRRALVAWYASVDGTLGLVDEFTSFAAWQPRSVAVAADDRVVVGGLSGGFDTTTARAHAVVARFTAAGTLDPTFSGSGTSQGRLVFDPPGGSYRSITFAVAVDADARPVAVGFGFPGPTPLGQRAFVARFPSSTLPGGRGLHVVTPNRVLDTRAGVGAPVGKLAAGSALDLTIGGTPGLPASGVDAVALNVTVTEPDDPGYLTAFPVSPCHAALAQVSNVNYTGGETIANLVTVPVAADGTVCLSAFSTTHVVADVLGWYGDAGAGFTAAAPIRLMDTRSGLGAPAIGKLEPGHPLPVVVPADPGGGLASAVSVVVTVTEPDGAGFVRIHPCNQPPGPPTSTVNFGAGETVANAAIVASDEPVCVEAAPSATHVIVDLAGWWGPTGGSGFTAVAPNRVLDTRSGVGAPPQPMRPGSTLRLHVTGTPGVPASDVTAVAVNLTTTEPVAPGYLRAFACDQADHCS